MYLALAPLVHALFWIVLRHRILYVTMRNDASGWAWFCAVPLLGLACGVLDTLAIARLLQMHFSWAFSPQECESYALCLTVVLWGATILPFAIRWLRVRAADPVVQRCLQCDYELTGLPYRYGFVRCPECGKRQSRRKVEDQRLRRDLESRLARSMLETFDDP